MVLEYLSDLQIIEWQNAKEWKIRDREKFTAFLAEGLPAGASILSKRKEAWQQTHTKAENEKFTDVLSSIVCFEGILPYSYISDYHLDQAMLDHMERLLWLAPSPSGQGITFFHDNIKEFCSTQPLYRKNAKILKQTLRWLRGNPGRCSTPGKNCILLPLSLEPLQRGSCVWVGSINNPRRYVSP